MLHIENSPSRPICFVAGSSCSSSTPPGPLLRNHDLIFLPVACLIETGVTVVSPRPRCPPPQPVFFSGLQCSLSFFRALKLFWLAAGCTACHLGGGAGASEHQTPNLFRQSGECPLHFINNNSLNGLKTYYTGKRHLKSSLFIS